MIINHQRYWKSIGFLNLSKYQLEKYKRKIYVYENYLYNISRNYIGEKQANNKHNKVIAQDEQIGSKEVMY